MLEQVLYELRLRFVQLKEGAAAHHRAVSATARVTFLGTGTSHGVPMIGCTAPSARRPIRATAAGVRRSTSSCRASSVLVDTSTDLRTQALQFGVHARGRDPLHPQPRRSRHGPRRGAALQRAAGRRDPVLRRPVHRGGDPAHVRLHLRAAPGGRRRASRRSTCSTSPASSVSAGTSSCRCRSCTDAGSILGYRIGGVRVPDRLQRDPRRRRGRCSRGVDLLVVDALRDRPHPTHFTVEQALAVVERLRPRRALFTHIAHDLPHAATCARLLPRGVELAYDGLILEFAV